MARIYNLIFGIVRNLFPYAGSSRVFDMSREEGTQEENRDYGAVENTGALVIDISKLPKLINRVPYTGLTRIIDMSGLYEETEEDKLAEIVEIPRKSQRIDRRKHLFGNTSNIIDIWDSY